MLEMSDTEFERCLYRCLHQVARECGHFSAYPNTREGRLAALRQRLRMMDEERWFFNDYQRTLVLREIRRLQEERHA
jgi:hypothetical protein